MKYYSEVTKKLYDSVEDLKKAELEVTNKAAARKKDADKVEYAFEAYKKAYKEYEDALMEFCNKYGSYHKTIKIPTQNASTASTNASDAVNYYETLSSLIDKFIN